jgi:hypothetical protein
VDGSTLKDVCGAGRAAAPARYDWLDASGLTAAALAKYHFAAASKILKELRAERQMGTTGKAYGQARALGSR